MSTLFPDTRWGAVADTLRFLYGKHSPRTDGFWVDATLVIDALHRGSEHTPVEIEFSMSNSGARAARADLQAFLDSLADRLSGAQPDPAGTATTSYVILRRLLTILDRRLSALDLSARREAAREAARERTKGQRRTVRERREQ